MTSTYLTNDPTWTILKSCTLYTVRRGSGPTTPKVDRNGATVVHFSSFHGTRTTGTTTVRTDDTGSTNHNPLRSQVGTVGGREGDEAAEIVRVAFHHAVTDFSDAFCSAHRYYTFVCEIDSCSDQVQVKD